VHSAAVGAPEFEAFVQLWQVTEDASGTAEATFLTELKGHTKNVNAVRFSPDGMAQSVRNLCQGTHLSSLQVASSHLPVTVR